MQSEKQSCDNCQIEPAELVYSTYVPLDNLRQRLPIHKANNGDL